MKKMGSWWLILALVACMWCAANACSCMYQHPQTHYCRSDFVIVGRVQKQFQKNGTFITTYKLNIRNKFKASPKADIALKSGRIHTPYAGSLCGIELQPRETYVLTGYVQHLEAHVNLCGSYYSRWRDVSPRQRKGFRLLYKQGCNCKVSLQFSSSPNTCKASFDECYEKHGICLRDRNARCNWTRAPRLTRCLHAQRFNGTMT